MFTIRADEQGALVLESVSPEFVVLVRLALESLSDEDERVRARLMPDVYADDAHRAEWSRYVSPELEHLFASRREIVANDLRRISMRGRPPRGELVIPAAHVSAWESALVGASHALFARYELTAEDLDAAEAADDEADDRDEFAEDGDVVDDSDLDTDPTADDREVDAAFTQLEAERQWAIARIRIQQHIYWAFRSARAMRERSDGDADPAR
jgi:hypothetical protein